MSQPVLFEAERNVSMLGFRAIERYHRQILLTLMRLDSLPSSHQVRSYAKITSEKDAHVLAAAVATQADFLITFDQPLATKINQASVSVQAVAPKEFIQRILVQHVRYDEMR